MEDNEGKLVQKEEAERPSGPQRWAGWVSTRPIDRPDGQVQMFPGGDRDMDIRSSRTRPRFDGNVFTVLKQRLCKGASSHTCKGTLYMGSSYMTPSLCKASCPWSERSAHALGIYGAVTWFRPYPRARESRCFFSCMCEWHNTGGHWI